MALLDYSIVEDEDVLCIGCRQASLTFDLKSAMRMRWVEQGSRAS